MEVSNNTTVEQSGVLEFLSNGTLGELLCMPQISKKKADAIIELRPFDGWRDMVEKFQQTKGLGGEILNSAQDYLYKRHVVTQLMNKCSKLSSELERMNFMGHSYVSRKPSLLSEELTLADYQMIGLNWLVMLQNRGLNGILADEMGLGKTVQVIAFLANLKETSGDDSEPNLIVVPSSTLDNWTNELERWCPGLKVLVYYGDKEERKSIRCSKLAQGNVKEYDVVLTTYNLITASPEEKKMFKVLKFLYVVFDEAHMLKNMKTARYEQLSRINVSFLWNVKHLNSFRIYFLGQPENFINGDSIAEWFTGIDVAFDFCHAWNVPKQERVPEMSFYEDCYKRRKFYIKNLNSLFFNNF